MTGKLLEFLSRRPSENGSRRSTLRPNSNRAFRRWSGGFVAQAGYRFARIMPHVTVSRAAILSGDGNLDTSSQPQDGYGTLTRYLGTYLDESQASNVRRS